MDKEPGKYEFTYRDRITTLDKKGKRKWMYPAIPAGGSFFKYRNIVAYTLLAFFFIIPFVKINGNPLLMLDFLGRKFYFLGVRFWPQDLQLFFPGLIALFVLIIFTTITIGRVWCGWTCPQTVFMEFIFRPVEHFIESSPMEKKRLDDQRLTIRKIWKKGLKHSIFYIIALGFTFVFWSYLVGYEKVWKMITALSPEYKNYYIAALVFAFVFYYVFARLRELICIFACPYGRLQGVIVDPNTIQVSYDSKRGEPRGKISETNGDCIDCLQCIAVCPTGVDIRDGAQLECIHCTACIDACNKVMKAVKKPKNLIRYDSLNGLKTGKTRIWNNKSLAYLIVLLILLGIFTRGLITREVVTTKIFRAQGSTYEISENKITNVFSFKFLNKTRKTVNIDVKVLSGEGEVFFPYREAVISGEKTFEGLFYINLHPNSKFKKVEVGIFIDNKLYKKHELSILGTK